MEQSVHVTKPLHYKRHSSGKHVRDGHQDTFPSIVQLYMTGQVFE